MQALILFVLFGIFAATIGGVITYSTESTESFVQVTTNAQHQQFEDLSTVVNGSFSPTYLDLPNLSTTANPAQYFCAQSATAMLLNCSGVVGGQAAALDQWGYTITGYILRYAGGNAVNLASSGAGGMYSVKAPVTGVVMVSGGPDGKIDSRLQTDLNNLNANTSLASLMAIAAYPGTDDIVVTFSNQQSQQDAIAGYQNALNRIAAAALANYQAQFAQYQPQLANVYAGQFNSGPINIASETQRWNSGTGAPTFSLGNLSAFGVTPEINEVQRGLCAQGVTPCPSFALGMNGTPTALNFWIVPQNNLAWSIPNNTSTVTAPSGCSTSPTVNCTQVLIQGN